MYSIAVYWDEIEIKNEGIVLNQGRIVTNNLKKEAETR
jgi:hypothetical protein